MMLKELREKRAEVARRQADLARTADETGSPFTKDERKEVERGEREFRSLDKQVKVAELEQPIGDPMIGRGDYDGRENRDGPPDGPGRNTEPEPAAPTEWRDTDGRPVHVLKRDQSLHQLVARDADPSNEVSPGGLIRAAITGKGDEAERRAMSVGAAVGGGFMLTSQMSARVIDLARKQSRIFQAGADIVVMESSELKMAKVATDPTATWVAENAAITSSEVTVGQITFRARKLGALVKISKELVDDAPNARAMVEQQLAKVLALEIDRVALLGDGDGEEPRGLFNHSDVQELSSVGSPTYDDFLDAIQLVEDVDGVPNGYMYSPDTRNTLGKSKAGDGNYLSLPPLLISMPAFVTRQLATSQAVLGDFTQVMVGVRRQIRVDITDQASDGTESAFDRDQVWIKATWRGDVQFAHASHLAKLTGIT